VIDVVLILVLSIGLGLGLLRGVIRQAMIVGAWLIIFVVAAHLRVPAGGWLAASSPQYALDYAVMLAFLALFLLPLAAAIVLAEVTGGGTRLTRYPLFDSLLGGAVGLLAAVLSLAAIVGILDTYFVPAAGAAAGELSWLRNAYQVLGESTIVEVVRETINPALGALLSPLLPGDVSAALAG
jgi:uncharacterized membrane protein required for colicin V production